MTWKQIKFIRGKSCKGKAVTWFSSIKKKYLTNPSNREISEGLSTYNPNNMSIMPDKADIKEDNRIKDWVLVEEKENSMTIRQKEDIQEVYLKIQNVANQKVLPVPKEVIAKKKMGNVEALAPNFLDPQLIVEASLAKHLVKSQVLNKALFFDLLEALEQNTLNRKEIMYPPTKMQSASLNLICVILLTKYS
ncbi:40470_t:CDS:2 [Gigaspora margarita]|uniref:40470_t:CDS:1 n=1 Tax=Gigaspora margarita TaxID=4874 RepID=A0ABN7UUS4_GIGMA|nr:40470_t:CDS:2 [Gigaspora margarita]